MMNPKNLFIAALIGLELPLLSLALANDVFAKPVCKADPCLDAVKKGAQAGGRGDCRAFFRTLVITATVTTTTAPASTTITKTHTPTVTVTFTTPATTPDQFLRARTNTPITKTQSTVPPYASKVCDNTKQYSSACSCIGATHGIVTSTRTRIKTTTSKAITTSQDTATAPTVTVCPQPQPLFYLQASGGGVDGDLAYVQNVSDEPKLLLGTAADNGTTYNASVFTRNEHCHLKSVELGLFANIYADANDNPVFFAGPPQRFESYYDPVVCLPTASGSDACYAPAETYPNVTHLSYCDSVYLSGTYPLCDSFTFSEIPVN